MGLGSLWYNVEGPQDGKIPQKNEKIKICGLVPFVITTSIYSSNDAYRRREFNFVQVSLP
jgi:hypothetical protein